MLWLSLSYAGGLFAGTYLWRPASWWLISIAVLTLAAAYLRKYRSWAGCGLALVVSIFLGALTIQIQGPRSRDAFGFAAGDEALITAHITRAENLRQRGRVEEQQRVDLETEQVTIGDRTQPIDAGIRSTFYSKMSDWESATATPEFHYGERIRFLGKLSPPRNFQNPGAFDYRGYLAEQGIVALTSAKAANVEVLPGFVGSRVELWRTRLHGGVIARIHQVWPEADAALVDAMLVGENSFLNRQLLTDFQRTGTYHVLVISGLKVGILAMVTFWLSRRFRVPELAASAIAIGLTVAYADLTDVGVPVWRATLMLALYFCAQAFYRRRAILNTIGVAALFLLVIDPKSLAGASFQLSFLCVLIIAAIGAPLLERTTRPLGGALKNWKSVSYDFALPPALVQWRLDLRMVGGRLKRFIGERATSVILIGGYRLLILSCEFLVVSFVIQIGFALPMACYFHRATLVALPANVLAVPLTEIAIVAALLAISISYGSLVLAKLPAYVTALSLHAMAGSVRWLGALRLADARVPTPQVVLILVCLAILISAMLLVRRRPLLATVGVLALSGAAFWIATVAPHREIRAGVLEMTAIDVGEGDSLLLVSPNGRTLLVDAGGIPHWMHSDLDIGEDVVSPYLWWRGVSRLDAVAVTHPHADHIGGMQAILENFHPRELWIASGPPNSEMGELLQKAGELSIPVHTYSAGDRFENDGIAFRVLAPEPDTAEYPRNINDDCLVLKATYRNTSVLLEGDAEKDAEEKMMDQQPSADLLKVAHHGSKTSTRPELLAAVHPRFAVISVGRGNVYGHPRMEVLQRLAEAHIRTYRTDMNGAVTFYLDGTSVIPAQDR